MALVTTSGKKAQEKVGASINPIYVHRQMKSYAVTENEIGILSLYNTHKAGFFSAGTFFIGLACSAKLNEAFANPPIPQIGQILSSWGIPIFIGVAIFFYAMGGLAIYRGYSAWQVIKSESVEKELDKSGKK